MRNRILFSLVAAVAGILPARTTAQDNALSEGTRARLVSASLQQDQQIVRIISTSNDTVVFRSETYPVTRSLALAEIQRVEVSNGVHRNTGRGAVIGLLAGGISGAIIGAATYTPCEGWCILEPTSSGQAAAWGAALLGGVGLVAGTVIGALNKTEEWRPLAVKPTLNAMAAGGGRVGLQFTHAF